VSRSTPLRQSPAPSVGRVFLLKAGGEANHQSSYSLNRGRRVNHYAMGTHQRFADDEISCLSHAKEGVTEVGAGVTGGVEDLSGGGGE
jgi:hypothetical protein